MPKLFLLLQLATLIFCIIGRVLDYKSSLGQNEATSLYKDEHGKFVPERFVTFSALFIGLWNGIPYILYIATSAGWTILILPVAFNLIDAIGSIKTVMHNNRVTGKKIF